jgi:hypothetical protein
MLTEQCSVNTFRSALDCSDGRSWPIGLSSSVMSVTVVDLGIGYPGPVNSQPNLGVQMTRIRISHNWQTIRGMRVRIVHRRRVAVKSGSSILRLACQGMATYGGVGILAVAQATNSSRQTTYRIKEDPSIAEATLATWETRAA